MSSNKHTDLSWLPSDAEEQLALGFRIISNAYKSRVQYQEAEIKSLKQQLEEAKNSVTSLQKKHSAVEVELIESHQARNQLGEENRTLVTSIKKLQKDIQRLETLKRAVLSSIHDGDRIEEDLTDKSYLSRDYVESVAPMTMQDIEGHHPVMDAYSRYAASNIENSPPPRVLPANNVDGKAFFRQAKRILPAEKFSQFLIIIRKLNTGDKTREQAMREVDTLFGDQHAELSREFATVLGKSPVAA